MLGLFTSKAYMEPAPKTPLLRRKLEQIARGRGPVRGLARLQGRGRAVRVVPEGRAVRRLRRGAPRAGHRPAAAAGAAADRACWSGATSTAAACRCWWRMPRDRFNAGCARSCRSCSSSASTARRRLPPVARRDGVRAHLLHRARRRGRDPRRAAKELEEEVERLARTWDDRLARALEASRSASRGARWPRSGRRGSPSTTGRTRRGPAPGRSTSGCSSAWSRRGGLRRRAAERAGAGGEPDAASRSTRPAGRSSCPTSCRSSRPSGCEVVEEVPTRLLGDDGQTYLHDFGVLGPRGGCSTWRRSRRARRRCDRGRVARRGRVRLAEPARDRGGLTWREVTILRAYRTYRQRVRAELHRGVPERRLAANPSIAAELVRLFEPRFDPAAPRTEEEIAEALPRDPARRSTT